MVTTYKTIKWSEIVSWYKSQGNLNFQGSSVSNRKCRNKVAEVVKAVPVHVTNGVSYMFQKWKQGKRKAEKDEYTGGKFFLTLETPLNTTMLDDV